jgi:hypothetical protein
MDRPLTLVQAQSHTYFAKNFLKVVSDHGKTLAYCTNVDLDRPGDESGYSLLRRYPLLILWNHDEYWSARERENTRKFMGLDTTVDTVGNIARFAPNSCFWQIHWVDSLSGDYLKLYCRKDNGLDTIAVDKWRNLGLDYHEAKFLGSEYEQGYNIFSPPAVVRKENHWVFEGTGLRNGDVFGIGHPSNGNQCSIVNGESDNTVISRPDYPLDTLADAYVWSYAEPESMCILYQMIYYEDTTTHAKVFAQGGAGWICAVDSLATFRDDYERMKRITVNIIDSLSVPSHRPNSRRRR